MAGHQWSKVERQPGALDAKCGKLVSKLAGTSTLATNAEALKARSGKAERQPGAVCPVSVAEETATRLNAQHELNTGSFGIEHFERNSVLRTTALGVHAFEPPLECSVAVSPRGIELHFHHTSRGHLLSVGDSFYEAYRGSDSTTLTGLHQNVLPLRTDKVAAQASRFSDSPGGTSDPLGDDSDALGENDDVHYVHSDTLTLLTNRR